MDDENKPDGEDDDSRYSHVKSELNFLRGKVEAHGGILEEIKGLIGGLGSSKAPEADAGSKTPNDPAAAAEDRPAKKPKRKWY